MHPDLISRSCGFIGIFIFLCVLGLMPEPVFQAIPQRSFAAVVLNLNETKDKSNTQKSLDNKYQDKKNNQLKEDSDKAVQDYASDILKNTTENTNNTYKTNIYNKKDTHKNTLVHKKEVSSKQKLAPNQNNQTIDKTKVLKQDTYKNKDIVSKKSQVTPNKQNTVNKEKNIDKKSLVTKNKVAKVNTSAQSSNNDVATANKTSTDTAKKSVVKSNASDLKEVKGDISALLFNEIKAQIKYPKRAVKRKIQGIVLIEFNIVNGKVASYNIVKSSGHRILDNSAKKLCEEIIGFNTLHNSSSLKIQIPIKYSLI